MPISALFLIMMGAGGFLVYAAVKNEHPWTLFTTQLSKTPPGPSTAPSNATIAGTAPAGQRATLGALGPQYGTPNNPTKAA